MTTTEFKVGDRVRWSSHAQGHVTTKEGEIICAIPPGMHIPKEILNEGRARFDNSPRAMLSYIVKVFPRPASKKALLYRPILSKLQSIEKAA